MRNATRVAAVVAAIAVAALAKPATAAEPWINIYTATGLSGASVEDQGVRRNADRQIIRTQADGETITFVVDRPTDASFLPLWDTSSISIPTRSAKNLLKAFDLDEPGDNFQKIRGADSRGASIDYRDGLCRGALVGVGKKNGGWRYLVAGFTCGAKDAMTRYLTNARPARDR